MNLLISVEYRTSWGESLRLVLGGERHPMRYIYQDTWQVELEDVVFEAGSQYGFEVWTETGLLRSEFRPHVLPSAPGAGTSVLRICDRWNDTPANAPFYSSFFTDVVFRRPVRKVRPTPVAGNVTFVFSCPEIRPSQTVAITGSGKVFSEWKKMIPLDDSRFPLWSVTLKVSEPFEYKFVVVDRKSVEPVFWENGGNHFFAQVPAPEEELVVGDVVPMFPTTPWRGAGTAVPVFSLRTEESFGVGEFNDLKKMVDLAVATGQNVIQLLPINDTTMTGTWQDSYPYNANTTFALHPQFLHLPGVGIKADKAYKKMRDSLNALPQVDYEKVNNEKDRLLHGHFAVHRQEIVQDSGYNEFVSVNEDWLRPYAVFRCLGKEFGTPEYGKWGKWAKYTPAKVAAYVKAHPEEVEYHYWVQYSLDKELRGVVAYAHSKGVAIKGDLPIGISRTSVDAWQYPELYHLDSQAGAPPDAFSTYGQNWGFPTYNWEKMAEDGFAWWKSRMRKMSEYFDAFRIDHILGFFRIWEIPLSAVHGLLGYFNPALPYSAEELVYKGFDMSGGRYSTPPSDEDALRHFFGENAPTASKLLGKITSQRVALDTLGTDPAKKELCDAFMEYFDDVLFVQDPRRPGFYHPRISASTTLTYSRLLPEQKAAFDALHTDFFYHRHNDFWKTSAMSKLPDILGSTGMLTCGEDLGMIPACVPDVMETLGILSLEIQRMPKDPKVEWADPATYPYYCVCATGTHDTSNLRAWWEEDPAATQKFYNTMLGCGGAAPMFCEPWICEKILLAHAKSPAMLCILPLQDWISLDGAVRYQGNPADERINVPAIPRFYWRYRMHLGLEKLIADTALTSRLCGMVRDSGRGE